MPSRQERVNKEVRRALVAMHYVEREQAKGHDVSRLAEKYEKSRDALIRHTRCFHCGEAIENPESVKAWERDHLGPICRERMAVAS